MLDSDAMDVDSTQLNGSSEVPKSPSTLDPMLFSSSFFQSAALTFQDHLHSSWLSPKAKEKMENFDAGLQDGSLHAEWKDDAWNQDNLPPKRGSRNSVDTDLVALAKRSLLQEGDIIAYKRTFPIPGITVEKDLLVRSINSTSHSLSLLLQPAIGRPLPTQLLVVAPPNPEPPTLSMDDIMGTLELEDGILDVDGRVSRTDRHAMTMSLGAGHGIFGSSDIRASIRTAKSFSVWRWREEMLNDFEMQMIQDRGGRELLGTISYLRSA